MDKWNKKNALRVLLYAVLYAVVTALSCRTSVCLERSLYLRPVFRTCLSTGIRKAAS